MRKVARDRSGEGAPAFTKFARLIHLLPLFELHEQIIPFGDVRQTGWYSCSAPRPGIVIPPVCHHGEHDVVKLFLEFQDELDAVDFVGDTKVNGLGGTDKIHRPGWLTRPVANTFHVQTRLFLLKQNPHCVEVFLLHS